MRPRGARGVRILAVPVKWGNRLFVGREEFQV